MTLQNDREKHLNYFGMRASRDVSKVFMYLKFGAGVLGILFIVGFLFFGDTRPGGGAGGVVYLAFVPVILFVLGMLDLFTIKLSEVAEQRMRNNDKRGRSNILYLVAVTIGGFLFLHLMMVKFLGNGYFAIVMAGGSGGRDPLATFMVFGPYVAFTIFMLIYWLTPSTAESDMSEKEEIALAESNRASHRKAIFAIYAVAAVLGAAILYFFMA